MQPQRPARRLFVSIKDLLYIQAISTSCASTQSMLAMCYKPYKGWLCYVCKLRFQRSAQQLASQPSQSLMNLCWLDINRPIQLGRVS